MQPSSACSSVAPSRIRQVRYPAATSLSLSV